MAIKFRELTIEQIKNVDHGNIKFYDSNGYINLLGIYGQNGSGKTTVVDAMDILKTIMAGKSIPEDSFGIFNTSEERLPKICIEIESENNLLLRYEAEFISDESTVEQNVYLAHEIISYKEFRPRTQFKRLFEFTILERDESGELEGSLKSRSKFISKDAIEVLAESALRAKSSVLFSQEFKNRLEKQEGKEIEKKAYQILEEFCSHIRIYTQRYANLTGMGAMPININYKNENHAFQGGLPAILNKGGTPIPQELLTVYEDTIRYMNEIIPVIIPDLTLKMTVGDSTIDSQENQYYNVNFLAQRNGKTFSLIHESEGIRKIISMIGFLIEVFNKPGLIAFIDEIDSGIFEYLLGELMEIFSNDASGQLVFTSHNLRILEMLPTRKIRFSTTNRENRYITLKGVKMTNNLRDLYLRSIQIGGADEELYKGQSQSKMRRALRKAGKYIGE